MTSARDLDAIAYVAALIHRVNGKRTCRCERCEAIRRVVRVARKAVGR